MSSHQHPSPHSMYEILLSLTPAQIIDNLGVDPATVNRWYRHRGTDISAANRRLLALLAAGWIVPPSWRYLLHFSGDFGFIEGDRRGYEPGELAARLWEYRYIVDNNMELRRRLKILNK